MFLREWFVITSIVCSVYSFWYFVFFLLIFVTMLSCFSSHSLETCNVTIMMDGQTLQNAFNLLYLIESVHFCAVFSDTNRFFVPQITWYNNTMLNIQHRLPGKDNDLDEFRCIDVSKCFLGSLLFHKNCLSLY